jgi:hypothetical protein
VLENEIEEVPERVSAGVEVAEAERVDVVDGVFDGESLPVPVLDGVVELV